MRCVSYTRFASSLAENDTPPDIIRQQNKRIEQFAKDNSWTILQKYSDRKNDKKAEMAFLQLKQDGMSRKFDLVIMDSFYRFGKSIAVARNLLVSIFFPAGIHFAVAQDNFCSVGKTAEDVERYIAWKYADYRTTTRWMAHMTKREEGFFNVHDERYGYLLSEDRRQLVIDEEAAAVIREVYQLTVDGIYMRRIAEILNEKGYDTPAIHLEKVSGKRRFMGKAKTWTANSVKTISNCPEYLGKVTKKVNDEFVEYQIPPIIDKEVFDKAAEMRRLHYHGSPTSRPMPNALRFLIRDKNTGQSMICISYGKYKDNRFFCTNRKKGERRIPYEEVLAKVTELLRKEQEQAIHAAVMLDSEEGRMLYEAQRQKIVREMRRLVGQISKISEIRIRAEQEESNADSSALIIETDQLLAELEGAFQKSLTELKDLETAFWDNPWIELFKTIEIAGEIQNAQMKKWVENVWVLDFSTVTIDVNYRKWKDMLPAKLKKG